MFSVMMIPMSLTSPIAIASPASDMMLLSTPIQYITPKLIASASGSVGSTASELRRCNRNSTTMNATTTDSSIRFSRNVAIVS